MGDEDHEFWGQLVQQLGIPENLRQHIETMAKREGVAVGLHPCRAAA